MEEILNKLREDLKLFYENNEIKKSVEKIVKDLGPKIKEAMNVIGETEFTHDGITAKVSESTSYSMNEEKLLDICKELNIEGLIKTKEYVDEQYLETLIYNKEVDAKILEPAKQASTTYKLLVKGAK